MRLDIVLADDGLVVVAGEPMCFDVRGFVLRDDLVVVGGQAVRLDIVLADDGLVVVAGEPMCFDVRGFVLRDDLVVVRRQTVGLDVFRVVFDDGLVVIRCQTVGLDVGFVLRRDRAGRSSCIPRVARSRVGSVIRIGVVAPRTVQR